MSKKPALGRGLSALLENEYSDTTRAEEKTTVSKNVGTVSEIAIKDIEANPFQPRIKFEEDELKELAQSIKELGVIQPVTVRKVSHNKYQLIAGERRFRASQIAGLNYIPAYIRVANDQSMLEMALVENIQRSNLNAIEVAISYQRLVEECSLTQEELSQRVGKKRSTITNYLRLLKLPAEIQEGIKSKQITMGHARALVNIENPKEQLTAFYNIIENSLSVRKAEEIAKEKKASKKPSSVPLTILDEKLKSKLTQHFKVKVKLQRKDEDKGKIIIPFTSEEELENILNTINL